MKPGILKEILRREIDSLDVSECAKDPERDFSRSRKLPLNVLVTTMLQMEGQSVGNELLSMFPKASETPSSAAFVQQRSKLSSGVFDVLFRSFVQATEAVQVPRTFHGMRLLAVDGSDIHIPTDLSDERTLCVSKEGQTPYNMVHLNAMYDLLQRTYIDEIIQDFRGLNEHAAFIEMVDRSWMHILIACWLLRSMKEAINTSFIRKRHIYMIVHHVNVPYISLLAKPVILT